MPTSDTKTPAQQIKEQLEQYQKSFELSVVDQFRQIALDAERSRARNNAIFAQVNAVFAPENVAPENPEAYGVFRNPTTGTLMVLSNVKQLNKATPLYTGKFSDCGAYINERLRVPKLKSHREVLFPEQGLEVIFDDPAIQDISDLAMRLQGGILKIHATQGDSNS